MGRLGETSTPPILILRYVTFNVSRIFMKIILFKIIHLRILLVGKKES